MADRVRVSARRLEGNHDMQLGMIGLGKMGSRLAAQAMRKGHDVVGYDLNHNRGRFLVALGGRTEVSVTKLALALRAPRVVFLYVPHGAPVDAVLDELEPHLESGDVVVDGGNSHWKASAQRHARLAKHGIEFIDLGTSGGLEGAAYGACFMAGGEPHVFARIEPVLIDLAVPRGVALVGPPGAGHFVKLIHNAIEFAMLQALGEGMDLLARSNYPLDLAQIVEAWCHGSVIRGWLVELLARALSARRLDDLSSHVEDTREVRWAIEYALEQEAWIPAIVAAELALYRYRDHDGVAGKTVALLRHAFGNHPLHAAGFVPAARTSGR